MELSELLARRRMHRSFAPDPVPEESIERIARVVRRAPSAGFSQGVGVVVVTDAADRRAIAEAFEDEDGFVAAAPVHYVVCVSERRYHERYRQADKLALTGGVEISWPVPYWFVDAGAALMLVLLAAIDEGLVAAFVGHPDQERILRELLGLPPHVVPLGVTLVGKPGPLPDEERMRQRFAERRRPLDEIVHRHRW